MNYALGNKFGARQQKRLNWNARRCGVAKTKPVGKSLINGPKLGLCLSGHGCSLQLATGKTGKLATCNHGLHCETGENFSAGWQMVGRQGQQQQNSVP